jgi:hypothetical protein
MGIVGIRDWRHGRSLRDGVSLLGSCLASASGTSRWRLKAGDRLLFRRLRSGGRPLTATAVRPARILLQITTRGHREPLTHGWFQAKVSRALR